MELRYRFVGWENTSFGRLNFTSDEFECTRDELERRIQLLINHPVLGLLVAQAESWNNETQEWELVY